MAEMVENILGGTTQPSAAPTSGEPASGDDQGGESRRDAGAESGDGTRADKRIQQLVAERNRVREAYAAERDKVSRLEERVSQIESQRNGDASERAQPRSWQEASEETLHEAIRTGVQDPERASLVDSAVEELVRRKVEGSVTEQVQDAQKDWHLEAHRQSVFGEIQKDFGEQISSEDSPLYRQADALASGVTTRYGEEALQRHPELIEWSFLKAQAGKLPELQKQLSDVTRENERLKSFSQLEPGGRSSAAKSDAQKEALGKGDTKGAINAVAGRLFGG